MQTGMDPVQLKRQEIPHKLSDQLWPSWGCSMLNTSGLSNNFCNRGRHAKACDCQLHHLGSPGSVPPCAGLQPPLGMCYLPSPHAVLRFMYELQRKASNCVEEMKDLFSFFLFPFFSCLLPFALLERQNVLENYQEFMQKRTVKSTNQL